ncbi:bifunctional methionine sulfoxide reductase B/A protein [bacterium]|nr:bifunctional methionine sulfoxide reductase B/A protein [bacterium]
MGKLIYLMMFTIIILNISCQGEEMTDDIHSQFNTLTPREKRIIEDKGTEPPFMGEYYKHYEVGTYTCRKCDLPLYRSADKFDSGAGWPSFDDELPGAVKHLPDKDGQRTEIICAFCGAHLGHVFSGENFTPKNTRHCVNSISMNFVPEGQPLKKDRAVFAAGCFWGVEHLFRKLPGVLTTRVGYTGGNKSEPSYQEVCSKTTGHAEALEIVFDPSRINYEELTRFFFEIHDFTQVDRQGPDIGDQYRSAIFFTNDTQKQIAKKYIELLENMGYKVATEVTEASIFWPAEDYHQDYYQKTGKTPYCHFQKKIFSE